MRRSNDPADSFEVTTKQVNFGIPEEEPELFLLESLYRDGRSTKYKLTLEELRERWGDLPELDDFLRDRHLDNGRWISPTEIHAGLQLTKPYPGWTLPE